MQMNRESISEGKEGEENKIKNQKIDTNNERKSHPPFILNRDWMSSNRWPLTGRRVTLNACKIWNSFKSPAYAKFDFCTISTPRAARIILTNEFFSLSIFPLKIKEWWCAWWLYDCKLYKLRASHKCVWRGGFWRLLRSPRSSILLGKICMLY